MVDSRVRRDLAAQIEADRQAGPARSRGRQGKSDDAAEGASTARSPSAGCGSGCCCPRSAGSTTSRSRNDEISRAIVDEARRYPGPGTQVIEYFRKTPQALAQLRAPLYEEKVVDFILELAKVDGADGHAGGTGRRTRPREPHGASVGWPRGIEGNALDRSRP